MENDINLQMLKEMRMKMDKKHEEYRQADLRIYDEETNIVSGLVPKIEKLYLKNYICVDDCIMFVKKINFLQSSGSFYFYGPGAYAKPGKYEFGESYAINGLYIEDFDTSSGICKKIKITDVSNFNMHIDKFIKALNNQIKEVSDEVYQHARDRC
ncbi:MAG: hypothetical protein [Wendovervirus sonii]|uniref:Uncharacterized protein n=1 Tax=phage Lak_Megaphage_Sonny TaxID=3109229 RepID=A0ABZ0Z5Y4_9CAUD|nr:MAG: hypothetical protein [phage Lak_Megaphage_Sonny]